MTLQTITDFLTEHHPAQREFCGPWFRSGELVMIYASRGTGKSLFCNSLAYGMATGRGFIGLQSPKPCRVGYLDFELQPRLGAKRFNQVDMASPVSADPDFLHVWTRGQDGAMPNISTAPGAAEVEHAARDWDVVIIDNLTTAAPPVDGRDDDVRIWYRVKPLLYRLRNADKCVVLVHHAGKSGQQLGTSLRENDMDIIIRLSGLVAPAETNTLQMYLDLEKTRDLEPAQREGLLLEYGLVDGIPAWTHKNSTSYRAAEIRRLAKTISNKNILAAMLSCPIWLVHKVLSEPDHTIQDELNGGYDEPLF